ncbi:nitroreductase family protein [Streptococcus suis]
MKNKIKKILPQSAYIFYRKLKNYYLISKRYNDDKKNYLKNSIHFDEKNSFNNLRGRITLDYHNLEKGLTHVDDMRKGFGQSAMSDLFNALDEYLKKGFPINDNRYLTAVSVLNKYVERHRELNYPIPEIESKVSTYPLPQFVNSGTFLYEYQDSSQKNFKTLLETRHSIRDFGNIVILKEDVMAAIELANRAPSACNRQPCKVYLVEEQELIKKLLSIQGGLNGNASNIQFLLLITSDKALYRWDHERNQNFIDGGIFSASLLYSLESFNIANCPLHCDLTITSEKKVRDILQISDSEDLINFVAVGSFPQTTLVPMSNRDSRVDLIINK